MTSILFITLSQYRSYRVVFDGSFKGEHNDSLSHLFNVTYLLFVYGFVSTNSFFLQISSKYSNEDCIRYRINLEETTIATKRRVISHFVRIFDLLGLISPLVIKLKILFQELWLLNLGWDEPLPPELAELWFKYRNVLQGLQVLKLLRLVSNSVSKMYLHSFSDAPIKAYSTALYCKIINEYGNIEVNMVASKIRVAPLKHICLLQLDLCWALLLSRLIKSIIAAVPHHEFDTNAWSNSTVVLSLKFKTFVANRTSAILETILYTKAALRVA